LKRLFGAGDLAVKVDFAEDEHEVACKHEAWGGQQHSEK
jgi:hypothetical protein